MTNPDITLLGVLLAWATDVRSTPNGPWVSTDDAMAAIEDGKRTPGGRR